jgi:hypothetical protein
MNSFLHRRAMTASVCILVASAASCSVLAQPTGDLSAQIAATLLSLTQTAAAMPTEAPPAEPSLIPTVAITEAPTAEPEAERPWKPCDDAPESQLRVGDQAYVGYEPPECNRVRKDPDKNTGEIIGTICPGEEVQILEGPVCNNNWVWWLVKAKDRDLEGWTVEGDQANYWLMRSE